MTHFTVGIIVPMDEEDDIHGFIDEQMRPYDENLEVDGHEINPLSKWDWYRVGGRWDGWIIDNPKTSDNGFNFGAKHESIENNSTTTEDALARGEIPHAIVTPDGEWRERGEMSFFGFIIDVQPDWDDVARGLLESCAGHRIVILDAHI